MPLFILIYHSIVLAEENFLQTKFGEAYTLYCTKVNRWIPSLKGVGTTFRSMHFYWKRWLIKEYNTQYVWLTGITLIILFKYPVLTLYNDDIRNRLLIILLFLLLIFYFTIRYLKKSGKWTG